MTNFLNYPPIEIEKLSHESRFEYFPQAIRDIDASDILIQKPNDPIIQKDFYSGKNKCHCEISGLSHPSRHLLPL